MIDCKFKSSRNVRQVKELSWRVFLLVVVGRLRQRALEVLARATCHSPLNLGQVERGREEERGKFHCDDDNHIQGALKAT